MDILPKSRSRNLARVAVLVASLMVITAGIATATNSHDPERVPVGTVIGEVDVGGLSYPEAVTKVSARYEDPLDQPVVLEGGGRIFSVVPREIGFSNDALPQLSAIRESALAMTFRTRMWKSLTGSLAGSSHKVTMLSDPEKLASFVQKLAKSASVNPIDAKLRLDGDLLVIDPDRPGFNVDAEASAQVLSELVNAGEAAVRLPGKSVHAATRRSEIRDVIVVKVGENRLYHYRGGALVKTYRVATGTARYPTPLGQLKIVKKRFQPTWVNPAKFPGGWGENLPARIESGPSNPLGTRALNINSPGIRIHGTSNYRSLGYNASHGCIRMGIEDAEELFDLVEVGTPVLIVRSGSLREGRFKDPGPTSVPLAENEANSTSEANPARSSSPSPEQTAAA